MSTEEPIKLRDGEVVLYRRANSNRWQARFKLPDNTWHRISTKRSNLAEAKRVASEEYDRARFRKADGIPAISKRFRDVAKLCVALMDKEIAAGKGIVSFKDYKHFIENYLIPFFGSKHIDNISQQDIAAFEVWRKTKMNRTPSKSTMLNHNAALNRVFQTAIDEGWVTKSKVPILSAANGRKSKRRPDFTPQEWRKLVAHFPAWIEKAQTVRNREMRELLRDHVLILANSGIRAGTEAHNLKWKQITWFVGADKQRYLSIAVSGKVGSRELIARHGCETFLSRIQSRFPELKSMTFDELLKSGCEDYVFRLPNGNRTTELYKVFHQFLVDIDLLKDKHGESRTLYSLRHTYATSRLVVDKVPIHQLAKQMGTSVAMIEKHYSHLEPYMNAEMFGGKRYEKKEPDPKPSSEKAPQTKKKSRSAS